MSGGPPRGGAPGRGHSAMSRPERRPPADREPVPRAPGPSGPGGGRRWAILALLAAAEVLGMAVWFSANAVAAGLSERWALGLGEIAWLTAAVQLGFVVGTAVAALLNLADVVPSRTYFSTAALLTAAANAALLAAPTYGLALVSRFVTGLMLAGVYPPAMKMIATWFARGRGLAIGTVVGALTLGKASPYLLKALALRDPVTVLGTTSAGAALAGLAVALLYRDGPHRFARRPFAWSLAGDLIRHRPTRLAILGYLGHMWELYAMWTWIPVYVAASLAASPTGGGPGALPALADLLAFAAIGAGALGCVWGGWQADRSGRERVVNLSLAVSGSCCLAIGLAYGLAPAWLGAVVVVWGFFVVADSAQFSTLVTEVAPAHAVGTALTLQTSLGFLLTLATIRLVPLAAELSGWRWSFALLALGPAVGVQAMRRLAALRRAGA